MHFQTHAVQQNDGARRRRPKNNGAAGIYWIFESALHAKSFRKSRPLVRQPAVVDVKVGIEDCPLLIVRVPRNLSSRLRDRMNWSLLDEGRCPVNTPQSGS